MKKASSLKSVEKSMASFMTTRLSSARCEGGPGNLPLPKVKKGGGGVVGKVLHVLGNTLAGQPFLAPLDRFLSNMTQKKPKIRGAGGHLTDP